MEGDAAEKAQLGRDSKVELTAALGTEQRQAVPRRWTSLQAKGQMDRTTEDRVLREAEGRTAAAGGSGCGFVAPDADVSLGNSRALGVVEWTDYSP